MMGYRTYYTSKEDMFVVTKDDGTLTGKYDTDIFCKDEKMANKICDFLNESHNKNERFEFMLNEFIRTERTEMGKSVLRQLKEALEL